MIFEITEELVSAKDKNFIKCLDNIFLGFIEGNHLIYMKPKVHTLILENYNEEIDNRLRNNLISFEENFMRESKMLLDHISDIIRIIPTSEKEIILKEKYYNVRNLHTSRFLFSSKIQKCTLLGENEEDSFIYKIMAEEYIKTKELSNISIVLKPENGGGNTTSPVFINKIKRDDEICLCILDSDKKFPNDSSLGATANRLKRESKDIFNLKYNYYIEERCRELENILPEGFYYKKYFPDINKRSIFNKLDILYEINHDFIYFLDMKDGLKHYTIRTEKDWNQACKLVDTTKTSCGISICLKKDKCTYSVIERFGNKILGDFINFYEEIPSSEFSLILKSADERIKKIWFDIGKMVFSWSCGIKENYKNT
jgi:hypothetical protein